MHPSLINFDPELIYGEEDKEYLANLTALEREQVLAERHEKLQKEKESLALRKRVSSSISAPDMASVVAQAAKLQSIPTPAPKRKVARPVYEEDDDLFEPSEEEPDRESDEDWEVAQRKSTRKAKAAALKDIKRRQKKPKTPKKPKRRGVNIDELDSGDIFDEGGEEISEEEYEDYASDEDTVMDKAKTKLAKEEAKVLKSNESSMLTSSVMSSVADDVIDDEPLDAVTVRSMILTRDQIFSKLKFPNIENLAKGMLVRMASIDSSSINQPQPRHVLLPILGFKNLNDPTKKPLVIVPANASDLDDTNTVHEELSRTSNSLPPPLPIHKAEVTMSIDKPEEEEYLIKLRNKGNLPSRGEVVALVKEFYGRTKKMTESDIQERLKTSGVKTTKQLLRQHIEGKLQEKLKLTDDDHLDSYVDQKKKLIEAERKLQIPASQQYALQEISKRNRLKNRQSKMAALLKQKSLKVEKSEKPKVDLDKLKKEIEEEVKTQLNVLDCDQKVKNWLMETMIGAKIAEKTKPEFEYFKLTGDVMDHVIADDLDQTLSSDDIIVHQYLKRNSAISRVQESSTLFKKFGESDRTSVSLEDYKKRLQLA
ncbi:hypothetical protein P9112_003391 [Eukaryota sp. TZLM1-RC]